MGKVASVFVGFVLTPILVVAALIAKPDFSSEVVTPATDVLVVRPGDAVFGHLRLPAPIHGLVLEPAADGKFFIRGSQVYRESDERFDPATSSFELASTHGLDWYLKVPQGQPFEATATFISASRVFAVASATPPPLHTALSIDGTWTTWPDLPTSDPVHSAAQLADGTIALEIHDHGLYVAARTDSQFHAVDLDAKLPDGDLYAFGNDLVLVTASQTKPASVTTQIIHLASRHVALGPAQTYGPKDTIRVSTAPTHDGVVIGIGLTTKKFDPRGLWVNLLFGLVAMVVFLVLAFYLHHVRRTQGTAAWGWVGLGAGIAFMGAVSLYVFVLMIVGGARM